MSAAPAFRAEGEGNGRPYRRKLIEVDLPLARINEMSATEMTGRSHRGHPATMHTWWARRPLAACRAVIFASMVDDPGEWPEAFPTLEEQRAERERLHGIIGQLTDWKQVFGGNSSLIDEARHEIARSLARGRGDAEPKTPGEVLRYLSDYAIYDPFCGRGSIPVEVQRLGMRAVGSDLNPVAVLITKALIELPSRIRGRRPANPDSAGMETGAGGDGAHPPAAWSGGAGLAADIRWYGEWMRRQARERIGNLYPSAILPGGRQAEVSTWLWARTVPCPNPACGIEMPLMNTFRLSSKRENEHWIRPVAADGTVSFIVQDHGDGVPAKGSVNGDRVICIACGSPTALQHIRAQARAGLVGERMTAMDVSTEAGRLFLSPTAEHERVAYEAGPAWRPEQKMPSTAHLVSGRGYGISHWHQLFTKRQLSALTTLVDLLAEVRALVAENDAASAPPPAGNAQGGEYADIVATYLALAISKTAERCSSFCRWRSDISVPVEVFDKQAIPMIWDFAETNPFIAGGVWQNQITSVAAAAGRFPAEANAGEAHQADAATTIHAGAGPVIVTDPPYYDNISYAELSDFFYVWLRPALRDVWPDLFGTLLAPIREEMIAAPRFENPRERFEELLGRTLRLIHGRSSRDFPSSVFYAYKQQEEVRGDRTSTGWETMLSALVSAGFQIVGTWPMDTENKSRAGAIGTNSLASSVVLVCRPRPDGAPAATRQEFLARLDEAMPEALGRLTREAHIAPADLAQAAIGPGMEVYSSYSRVETLEGDPVPVREALGAINRAVERFQSGEMGALDPQSRFCLNWLRQHGFGTGPYGAAQSYARAMDVEVEAMAPRLLTAARNRVRLRAPGEYGPGAAAPPEDMTAWEGCFRMAWHIGADEGGGERGAARVKAALDGAVAERALTLARNLYRHYDERGDSGSAVRWNALVSAWPAIEAAEREIARGEQPRLGLGP